MFNILSSSFDTDTNDDDDDDYWIMSKDAVVT